MSSPMGTKSALASYVLASGFNDNLVLEASYVEVLPNADGTSVVTGVSRSGYAFNDACWLINKSPTASFTINNSDSRSYPACQLQLPSTSIVIRPLQSVALVLNEHLGWIVGGGTYTGNSASQSTVTGELHFVANNGEWFMGPDVANPPPSRDFVAMGVSNSYAFTDGVTNGTTTLTSPSEGGFSSALIGATISGAGIPAGTTVAAVASATSLTMSAAATASASGVTVTIATSGVTDLMYWKHRGRLPATLGVGVTPPTGRARLQVAAADNEDAMGTLALRRGPTQTGDVLAIHDSTPTDQLRVDKDFFLVGGANGVKIKAESGAQGYCLTLAAPDGTNQYRIHQPTGSGSVLRIGNTTNNAAAMDIGTTGSVKLYQNFGAFGANPVAKPTVTGSVASGAALTSLLTALASLGWITNNTTA